MTKYELWTIRPYGAEFLIECNDNNKCYFSGKPVYEPYGKHVTLTYHTQTGGWTVPASQEQFARKWVEEENECEVEEPEGCGEFYLEPNGQDYILKCSDPSECDWWGKRFILLSDEEGASKAYLSVKNGGYNVKNKNLEEAEQFVNFMNNKTEQEQN